MNIVIIDCKTRLATSREMTKEEATAYNADRAARLEQVAIQEKAEAQDLLIQAKAELEAAKQLGTEGVDTAKVQTNYDAALARWQTVKAVTSPDRI